MSFADSFWDGTYQTTTDTIGATVPEIYYNKTFLETVKNLLKLLEAAQIQPLPEGEGLTVQWDRYLTLATSAARTPLTQGQLPNATAIKASKVQATLKEYGAYGQVTSLLKKASIDRGAKGMTELFGEQGATVIDTLAHMELVANGLIPMRADFKTDSVSKFRGTVDSATATTVVDASLTANANYGDADDDLNQSIIVILKGTGYGQARPVTDYVASSGTMTVPTWDTTPAAGDTYMVVCLAELTASDQISYQALVRASRILDEQKAMTFGGYYLGVIDPESVEALQNDENWIRVHSYDSKLAENLFSGEIGRLGKVRFTTETNPFACPIADRGTSGSSYGPGAVGANYVEAVQDAVAPITGYVKSNMILGRNCFGAVGFQNSVGQIRNPPIYISDWRQLGQPLPRFSSLGWLIEMVIKALNSCWGVCIWTGSEPF